MIQPATQDYQTASAKMQDKYFQWRKTLVSYVITRLVDTYYVISISLFNIIRLSFTKSDIQYQQKWGKMEIIEYYTPII